MNKHLLSILALALAATACEKQGNDPGTQTPVQGKIIKVPIEISSPATRTHLGENERDVEWTSNDVINDVIGLWDGQAVSTLTFNRDNKFTGEINASDTKNEYDANIGKGWALTNTFYGIYPAEATYDDKEVTFSLTLPTAQAATPGSFAEGANIAVATGKPETGKTLVMPFQNAVSYLKVHVDNDLAVDITSLSIHDNNKHKLTGSVTVKPAAASASPAATGESSTGVSLTGPITKGSDYYLCVIPQTGVQFRLDFIYNENAYSLLSSSTYSLSAGEVKYIANINNDFIEKQQEKTQVTKETTTTNSNNVTYILIDSDGNMHEFRFANSKPYLDEVELKTNASQSYYSVSIVPTDGQYIIRLVLTQNHSNYYFAFIDGPGQYSLKYTETAVPSEKTATRFKAVYKI